MQRCMWNAWFPVRYNMFSTVLMMIIITDWGFLTIGLKVISTVCKEIV